MSISASVFYMSAWARRRRGRLVCLRHAILEQTTECGYACIEGRPGCFFFNALMDEVGKVLFVCLQGNLGGRVPAQVGYTITHSFVDELPHGRLD